MTGVDITFTSALGAVSLFPAIARIERLKNFYPTELRQWFIVLSTVFSLVVYGVVGFFFKRFVELVNVFVPLTQALAAALVLLVLYLVVHLGMKKRYSTMKPVLYAPLMVGLIVVYTGWIVSLTYTFNVLNQYRNFNVIRGNVALADSYDKTGTTTVILGLLEGDDITTRTSTSGNFTKIVTCADFAKISSISAEHRDLHNLPTHFSSWKRDEIPIDEFVQLNIQKTGS